MFYGAKIYYLGLTGQVLQVIQPQAGEYVQPTTKEQDMELYESLRGRVPGTVRVLQLDYPYGKYAENFSKGFPVLVDPILGTIMFQDYSAPEIPAPEPELSLADRLDESEQALAGTALTSMMLARQHAALVGSVDESGLALADLAVRHLSLQADFKALQDDVESYKYVTAVLLSEVYQLKSQLGGVKDESNV